MGNVHASESGVPPSPPPGSPGEEKDKNPGTVDDLHRECKELFPMAFEGGKLIVQKALSNNFQVQIYWINLNVHMCHVSTSLYFSQRFPIISQCPI